jgi:hypothetical protein
MNGVEVLNWIATLIVVGLLLMYLVPMVYRKIEALSKHFKQN